METPNTREQRIRVELDRLRTAHPKWRAAQYTLRRFFVRLLRIVSGVMLAAVATYLYDLGSAKTDIPFASMTLKDLATVLSGFAGAAAFVIWAFQAAFGAAPDRQQIIDAELSHQAEEAVAATEAREAASVAATKEAADGSTWWYRHGRALGQRLVSMRAQHRK